MSASGKTFVVPDGMPTSVFRDKYARRTVMGEYETWTSVAARMVVGNVMLAPGMPDEEAQEFLRLATAGVIPMSGRHLQHGDENQPGKQMELFTNCSTAMFSWATFLLLMKGSGVGRDYSSDICFVDWDYLPECRFVLEGPDKNGVGGHPDYEPWIEPLAEACNKYDAESEAVRWFEVADSAEGWAKVVMVMETAAFHKHNRDTVFVFDFSGVRRKGSPLVGQQGRPASGPVPFIRALHRVMSLRGAGMKPWKQALFIDHYLAECVVVGGVRRSARMAVKSAYDRDVIEFIDVKRGGYLWSANNSIGVDAPFWAKARDPRPSHERRVFEAAVAASYWDDTGEPGFLNLDRLNDHANGLDTITPETYLSKSFIERIGGLHDRTRDMIAYHLKRALSRIYKYICNPCGEIPLAVWGAYCLVADECMKNAENKSNLIQGVRHIAKALIRVNTMDCIYAAETLRTNRIGVSLTGIHEYAWFMGYGFDSLIGPRSGKFWQLIDDMREAVEQAADEESDRLGLVHPATYTCIKPSGTVSKVMQCTEGAHLPSQRFYLRWILFTLDSPELEDHRRRGYPVKDVSHRIPGSAVVGFPTCLPLAEKMPLAFFRTASEVSPQDQYKWLRLLEEHWLGGGKRNNQVSYTLKWRKSETSFEDYARMVLDEQPTVRCCALMPDLDQDASAYAYVPEETIDEDEYRALVARIDRGQEEAYGALDCETGACPIEENIR